MPAATRMPSLPRAARAVSRRSGQGDGGFTLVELILVMTMMVIVLGVAAPSLSRFFRGRTLDSEAKRFLALTRYGQSRAVSDGIPMLLWVDPDRKAYGLQADSSYVERDEKMLEYQWSPEVQIEVEQSSSSKKTMSYWKGNSGFNRNVQKIRFTPDGFISESSPELIVFRGPDQAEILVGENEGRMKYEIQTNQVQKLWR